MVDGETELLEENGLGYHIVSGNFTISELTEMLLLCDSELVDSVIRILTMGIQVRNENWMKLLSAKGPYDEEATYGEDEDEIRRRAEQALTVLQLYAQAYNAMDLSGLIPDELDENLNPVYGANNTSENLSAEDAAVKKMDEGRYKIYKIVFDELAEYPYGTNGATLKDFFCSLAQEGDARTLYPLVSVLSDGEFAALSYGCFLEIATGASATAADFDSYDELYALATEEVQAVYLYHGVDEALLNEDSVIGFTEAANRHMATTGELEFYEKESLAEDVWETGKHVAMLVGSAGMAIMGVAKITTGISMAIVGIAGMMGSSVAESAFLAGLIKFCSVAGGPYVMLAVIVCTAAVALVSFVLSVIIEEINGRIDWEKNPMPSYLYDVKEVNFFQTSANGGVATEQMKRTVFAFYEAVMDVDGNVIDLNAKSEDASQWIAMYVSYDRQGDDAKPVKAEDLRVQTGSGVTPEGYVPLTRFGEVVACNLNQWDEDDDVNGVYLFYKQDQAIAVDDGRTYYIYDVYLQTGESDTHCLELLKAAGYTPINVNLSPSLTDDDIVFQDKIYTYLGYKVTTNPSSAIRDLRVIYGPSQGEIKHGASTYAECGSNGTVTLYATKYKSAGTPLLAGGLIFVNDREDAPAGYEPVNFFAGGSAAPINVTKNGVYFNTPEYYLYFLPETTFTGGVAYLGGIAYLASTRTALVDPLYYDDYRNYVVSYLREKNAVTTGAGDDVWKKFTMDRYVFCRSGYDSYMYVSTNGGVQDSVFYYQTYNPYRAVYGLKATEIKTSQSNLLLENVGYVAWNTIQWYAPKMGTSGLKVPLSVCIMSYNGQGAVPGVEMSGKLFVTGNPATDNTYNAAKQQMTKVQPTRMSDIQCVVEGKSANEAFRPVTDIFTDADTAVTFKNKDADKTFSFYIVESGNARPYISGILAIDELTLYRASGGKDGGITRQDINDAMLYAQLANQGATNFCDVRINMLQPYYDVSVEMNAIKFGYKRSATGSDALRDVFLYFNGFSTDEPPKEIYRGTVKYTLLCEIPYNLTGFDGAPKPGVYLYGTTNSKAGNRIIDFEISATPFMEGFETVRTMNGRSLWSEMTDYMTRQKNSHLMGEARELYSDLLDFFTINSSLYRENEAFYLHIKREDTDLRVQKPYIEKLYLANSGRTEKEAVDILFDQGAEGYVAMDFNEGAGGDYVYIGYSYTANPEDAIKEIRAYHKKNPPQTLTDDDGYRFTLVDNIDMNKGAGGNYIYLYTSNESEELWPVMSLSGAYKVNCTAGKMTWVDGSQATTITYSTRMWDSSSSSDLNASAGGKYVYLMYSTVDSSFVGTKQALNYGTDKTYSRNAYSDKAADGEYIGGLYVMDKNTIRQEKLAKGVPSADCTCDKITDQEVFDRLKAMGATTIIETPILVGGVDYFKNNQNKVFIGYSRTNSRTKAIKNIALKATVLGLSEPGEKIEIEKKTYNLVGEAASKVKELPRAINLIGVQDSQDMLLPRLYLYYTTSGNDPVYDICIDADPLKNGWLTAKSEKGIDPFADLFEQADQQYELAYKDDKDSTDAEVVYTDSLQDWMEDVADMFNPEDAEATPFYIHTKNYAAASIQEMKPYIGEIFVAEGDSRHEALSRLVAFAPDGFIDCDLNKNAGGNYVYLAYKRVAKAKDALRDIAVFEGKNPEYVQRIDIGTNSVKYTLVADVDLNSKAGGKYLYLYTSVSGNTGNPITDLSIGNTVVSYLKCGIEKVTVKLAQSGQFTDEYIDLNKSAGGDYLYMVMQRLTNEGHNPGTIIEETHVDATCGAEGYHTTVSNCTDCGELVEIVEVIPAYGEHFDSDNDGNHNCDVCGEKDITFHVEGEVYEENRQESTCMEEGSYELVIDCTECGDRLRSTTVVIPINPEIHMDGNDANHDCDLCGAADVEGHTEAEPVVENRIEPTANTAGSYRKVIYCSECGEKLKEETIVLSALNEATPKENQYVSSVVGNGSVIAVCAFAGLGILAAIIVFIAKKRKMIRGDNET